MAIYGSFFVPANGFIFVLTGDVLMMSQVGDSLTMPLDKHLQPEAGAWKLCMNIDRPEPFPTTGADSPELLLAMVCKPYEVQRIRAYWRF